MDNQHRKITGYRELDESEVANMNRIKELGAELGELVDSLEDADPRWVAIGKTDLQTGIMALVRAVAQPTSF